MLSLLAPTLKTIEARTAEEATPWWLLLVVAGLVIVIGALLVLLAARRWGQGAEKPCRACGRILMAEWSHCMFCKAPRDLKVAQLQFLSGPLAGRTITLEGEVTTIGSSPENSIMLGDGGVSRKHIGIRLAEANYELADLGSTNGVYVNGEKVPRKMLQLGDVIRVGATEMVFKL